MPERDDLIEVMGHDNYAALSGFEVLVAAPGYAEVKMPVEEKILNGHGNVHGGAMFTLADYASAIASNMMGEPTMALDGSITFMRAVRAGHVLAKASTVKTGRRVNFQKVDLYNDKGEVVAMFQGAAIKVERSRGK